MDKKRKIRKSKRKQQVKRQLYFITAAVICVGIISTALILRTRKEEAKEAAAKIEQQNREKSAKENIEQAKYDLKNFSQELNDVNLAYHLDIETGDFLSFADWFFDGFVVDWMVQDKIKQASRQVAEALQKVEEILRQLQGY